MDAQENAEYMVLLSCFYQSLVDSRVFDGMLCWGKSIKASDAGRMNKLVTNVQSVVLSLGNTGCGSRGDDRLWLFK